jgi:hypothetical protein
MCSTCRVAFPVHLDRWQHTQHATVRRDERTAESQVFFASLGGVSSEYLQLVEFIRFSEISPPLALVPPLRLELY